MYIKIRKTIWIVFVSLLSLSVLSPRLSAAGMQDEDTQEYKRAYNLILDEKWEEAHKALENFIRKFRRSDWIDDARFWQCYTREKLNSDLEEVFDFSLEQSKASGHRDGAVEIYRLGNKTGTSVSEGPAKRSSFAGLDISFGAVSYMSAGENLQFVLTVRNPGNTEKSLDVLSRLRPLFSENHDRKGINPNIRF